ncbi:DNA mismatch repair protein MutS [bacterium]|nr:DNA mismatch repair protein MutS [bacterium]
MTSKKRQKAGKSAQTTPMMQQYRRIRAQYPDTIMLFRMGDFYEMFGEDAVIGSQLMDIALTSRNRGKPEEVPLCGIPYHALDVYLKKLIKKGKKVAICEQVEDPKTAKGVVKRDVVRIVSPGTVIEAGLLSEKESSFICSVHIRGEKIGLAVIDLSTGDFHVTEHLGVESASGLKSEFSRWEPKELVIAEGFAKSQMITELLGNDSDVMLTPVEDWVFDYDYAHEKLLEHFQVHSLDGFGCEGRRQAIVAGGALVHYLLKTQKRDLSHIAAMRFYTNATFVQMDEATIRNLELVRSGIDGTRKGTLLSLIDKTQTAMGARLLRRWLLHPLIDVDEITSRLDAVSEFVDNFLLRDDVRGLLKAIRDMERLISRIGLGTGNARDLVSLKESLLQLPSLFKMMSGMKSNLLVSLIKDADTLSDIAEQIDSAVVPDPPFTVRDGGMFCDGWDEGLDELRSLARDGKRFIAGLEQQERARTGIQSLKIGYNRVFGYYIELRKSAADRAPDDYIRKQTLLGAERFATPELKQWEEKVLSADEKICELEYRLFMRLRDEIAKQTTRIQAAAKVVATIDVLASFAQVAAEYRYAKPTVNNGTKIEIREGRHPVVERVYLQQEFVPNDLSIDRENGQILIITGPNMAGKSTYIRQAALIVILAQAGCFVPASEALIGVVDKVFTRVGATDFLVRGQSTFMVEMNETANILNNATKRSLIVLDEIGRGTSTYDGLSIAWAVAEYLHNTKRVAARTLFATHYHELAELAVMFDRVKNLNVTVREWGDRVVFLRKVVPGSADRSYGIQVARLAGLPKTVLDRAKEILRNLERAEVASDGTPALARTSRRKKKPDAAQLSIFAAAPPNPVLMELESLDLDTMTPLDALTTLAELKRRLKKS